MPREAKALLEIAAEQPHGPIAAGQGDRPLQPLLTDPLARMESITSCTGALASDICRSGTTGAIAAQA